MEGGGAVGGAVLGVVEGWPLAGVEEVRRKEGTTFERFRDGSGTAACDCLRSDVSEEEIAAFTASGSTLGLGGRGLSRARTCLRFFTVAHSLSTRKWHSPSGPGSISKMHSSPLHSAKEPVNATSSSPATRSTVALFDSSTVSVPGFSLSTEAGRKSYRK